MHVLHFVLALSIALIPTGFLVSMLVFQKDIRTLGSGNSGGTNVWRNFGWKWGLFVILFDITKAMAVVLWISSLSIFHNFGPNQLFFVRILSGSLILLINIFNPLLRFRGGKGIATGIGILFGLDWLIAVIALCFFLLVAMLYKFKSNDIYKASLTGAATAFVFSIILQRTISEILFLIGVSILILFAHRKNIKSPLS